MSNKILANIKLSGVGRWNSQALTTIFKMLLHFPANTTNPAGYPRTGELPQHVGMRFSLATLSAINQQPAVILFLLVLTNPSQCGGQICDIYFVFYAKIYSEQVDAAPYGQIL